MATIYPVIMSGGVGSRLWPLSRKGSPKQYQALISDRTMLEETVLRVGRQIGEHKVSDPIIICGEAHGSLVQELLTKAGLPPQAIILEPEGRNTAPVAIIASLYVKSIDPEGLVLLLPADHHVKAPEAFRRAIGNAAPLSLEGHMTTFGITPTHPETGYGYINYAESLGTNAFDVAAFVEKPDRATAETYLADGQYAWNAGIFLFSASSLLNEARLHAEDILDQSTIAFDSSSSDGVMIALDREAFAKVRSDSIDYAIMEKTDKAAMVGPVDIGWNDIGSWLAVRDQAVEDGSDLELGPVITKDCVRSYIRSEGPVLAAIGLEDVIVIAMDDTVLVAKADRAQDVKTIVDELKRQQKTDLL